MKNLIISALALFALTANAQQKVIYGNDIYFNVIPAEFSYSQKPILHMVEDEQITLYNEEIDQIGAVTTGSPTHEYTLEYADSVREITGVRTLYYNEEPSTQFNERYTFEEWLDEGLKYLPSDYIIENTNIDNGDILIFTYPASSPESTFFAYQYCGKKYPWRYQIYKKAEDRIYNVRYAYEAEFTDWTCSGIRQVKNSTTTPVIEITYKDYDNTLSHDGIEFILSQTLFNEDEDYEYIVPKVTMIEGPIYSIMEPDTWNKPIELSKSECITRKDCPAFTGVQVRSANGTILHDIDFGENFILGTGGYTPEITIIKIGSNIFLTAECEDLSSNESRMCTIFYKIDKATNSIHQVRIAPSKMRVSRKNTTINVQFSQNDQPSKIILTSTDGITIASQNVLAGQTEAHFRANVPHGILNIARIQNGKVIESSRILQER